MSAMDATETTEVIAAAGGDVEFARLLKIDQTKWFRQRVSNWKRRGMPAAVVLAHYDQIQRLRRRLHSVSP